MQTPPQARSQRPGAVRRGVTPRLSTVVGVRDARRRRRPLGRPFLFLSDGTMTAPASFALGALIAHTGARAFAPRRLLCAGPFAFGRRAKGSKAGDRRTRGPQSVDWFGLSVHPRCDRLAAGASAERL